MNSAQFCGVSQYTSATTAAAAAAVATKITADTNQFPPTVMTTATSAIGYANGILYLEHDAVASANNANNDNKNNDAQVELRRYNIVDNDGGLEDANNNLDDDDGDDGTDSFASMETLSDNVSIWIDGEKHWISGVDANTTCADLILALLNYQDGQQMFQASVSPSNNSNNNNNSSSNNNGGENASNSFHGNDANNTNNCRSGSSNNQTGNNAINQSTTNTKEDCRNIVGSIGGGGGSGAGSGAGRLAALLLLDDYVIVRQHRHCEEYLDGSTKVFDVLPTRDIPTAKKECELMLRRLTAASTTPIQQRSTQVSSLLSTDKDSGMGSPVGSCSRSAKFRRRKHKSSNWLAQGNTLHPKLSSQRSHNSGANERLMKIILAQDETIHRQLSLLRDKERQISRIEEEKHRVRERELGKNYLLETYLNGLDEADDEPDLEEGGVEIFIDEPYHRFPAAATATKMTSPTTKQRSTQKSLLLQRQKLLRKQRSKDERTAAAYAVPAAAAAAAAAVTITKKDTLDATDETTAELLLSADGGNQKEIELQILWLERVYAINKQLQREEELLVKLHAKVRKHHVKRAYQTQKEVIQQIDKLDTELTRQCADIRAVEDNLLTSNEQLERKLCILEQLSQEFLLQTTEPVAPATVTAVSSDANATSAVIVAPSDEDANPQNGNNDDDDDNDDDDEDDEDDGACKQRIFPTCNQHHENPAHAQQSQTKSDAITMANENIAVAVKTAAPSALVSAADVQPGEVYCKPTQTQTETQTQTIQHSMQLQQLLQTPADLLSLQKLIAKPTSVTITSALQSSTSTAIATSSAASSSTPSLLSTATAAHQKYHRHGMQQQPHQNNYPISCINHCGTAESHATIDSNSNISSSINIDKNMLPLHVSNVKTLKKQMFGPAKSSLNQTLTPSLSSQLPTQLLLPPAPPSSSSSSNQSYHQHSGLNTTTSLDIMADITRLGTLV